MQERFRRLVAPAFLLGAAVIGACSHKDAVDPTAACGEYFDAVFQLSLRCAGAPFPLAGDAGQRLRSRFLTSCKLGLAIHGTGVTPDWLHTCAAGLNADSCGAYGQDPACEAPPGAGDPGAACSSSVQCRSTHCETVHAMPEPDVCGPLPIAIGAACQANAVDCVATARCEDGTCVAIRLPAENGLGCDQPMDCKSSVCDAQTKLCHAPYAAGLACEFPFDCATGLACINGMCAPQIAEGSACAMSAPPAPQWPGCAPGLRCDPAKLVCVAVQFAQAGQTCDNALTFCEVGSCNVNGAPGTATCPQVIADGAACVTSADTTCDTFAECVDGTCVITPSPTFQ